MIIITVRMNSKIDFTSPSLIYIVYCVYVNDLFLIQSGSPMRWFLPHLRVLTDLIIVTSLHWNGIHNIKNKNKIDHTRGGGGL